MRRTRTIGTVVLAILATVALLVVPASAATTNVGDAYANKAAPGAVNGGGSPVHILRETTTTGKVGYLKFTSTDAGVGQLTLYFTSSAAGNLELRRAPTGWSESTLTWNNRPCPVAADCPLLDTKPIPAAGQTVTLNAGDIVAGANAFAVFSLSASTSYQAFGSKESKKAAEKPVLTVSPAPTTTTAAPTTTTVPEPTTTTAPPPPPTSILDRTDLIKGSEIGSWRQNAKPAVDPATPIPGLISDAGIKIIRFAAYDCFNTTSPINPSTTCGRDNHAGTLDRATFRAAVQGIVATGAIPVLKMVPIAGAAGVNGVDNSRFCPPWGPPGTGADATQNLTLYKDVVREASLVYSGPLVLMPMNEMQFDCTEGTNGKWDQDAGVNVNSGSAGVSRRIGEHYAQNVPPLKAYAQTLGFSEVVVGGEVGVSGGSAWGDTCTPDASRPFGYACDIEPTWLGEFFDAVSSAGQCDNLDFAAFQNYYHSPYFYTTGAPYEGSLGDPASVTDDDQIMYSWNDSWIRKMREVAIAACGATRGNLIRGAMSEGSYGASSSSQGFWSGWQTDGRPSQFVQGWLNSFKGSGGTTGSGTRYWMAINFNLASNSDTNTGRYYNLICMDGTVTTCHDGSLARSSYDTFKNFVP